MYIKSIELNNVRGVRHLKAEALPEAGVIVIHGDNEAGKSTIVDAVQIVLTQPHSSKSATSKASFAAHGAKWLKPADSDEAPEVEVSLEVGEYDLTIFKRFLKRAASKLTISAPTHEVLAGEAADRRLQEILEANVDMDLFGALFLNQDDLGRGIAASGLPSLTGALERATGSETPRDAAADTALLAQVQAECGRYFTGKSQKPTGEYLQLQKRVAAAEQAAAEADERVRSLDRIVADYERAERTVAAGTEELPRLRADVEDKRAAAEAAAQAQSTVDAQRVELARAAQDKERAEADLARRTQLAADAQEARTQLDALSPALEQARAAAAAEADKLAAATAALEETKAARDEARSATAAATALADAARARAQHADLSSRVAELAVLEKAVAQAREAAAARGRVVTDKDVTRAEAAANAFALAQRLREQSAARLFLTAASATSITVDGADVELPAGTETAVPLAEGAEILIGDVTARFAAGRGAGGDAEAEEERARRALEDVLAELRCADVDAVRALRDEHRRIDERFARAKADFSAALRGADLADLRAELAHLEAELGSGAAEAGSASADSADTADAVERLSVEEAAAALAAAQEAQIAAEDAVDRAQATVDPLREKTAERQLTTVEQRAESARAALERAESALAAAEEGASRESLAAVVDQAAAAHAELAALVAAAEAELAALDPVLAQKLLDGALEGLKSTEASIKAAENELLTNKGRIELAEGAAEAKLLADAELEFAQSKLANVERRAAAARRLLEVMEAHRDAARRRYAKPFADKLSELARIIYGPGVYFELDENLEVVARTTADATVSLAELSGGAKEQLALVTRFAIAQMVASDAAGQDVASARRGTVPIFVDDALGSTDSRRLELMSTLFGDAGRSSQVIVLTCMPERYRRIPGRVEHDIAELKSERAEK